MAHYHHKGWRLNLRFIFAMVGVLLGASGALCFSVVYHNYHCAIWAFVSGVLAMATFILHLAVWKDLTYSINPSTFKKLMYVGVFSSFLGFGVFVGYLAKGIMQHESGVQVHGWFIVCVWGWMTWKWGFWLFWYSKNYVKALSIVQSDILSVNQDDSDYST